MGALNGSRIRPDFYVMSITGWYRKYKTVDRVNIADARKERGKSITVGEEIEY